MYYQNIHPDPKQPGPRLLHGCLAQVSDDGGRTFDAVGDRTKHVDNHYYWIDPDDSDHLLGCDGGLYESWDRGQLWRFFTNLSVTQFYNVDVDNASPIYNVYGGTQDNATLGGPSRSRAVDGATNDDWFVVTGGDGFVARIDPTDPNIVYGESQYGGHRPSESRDQRARQHPTREGKGDPALRFNWETPFIISPHSPARLYLGANRLFSSDDRGNSWRAVSPDLTRQIDRNTAPRDGPRLATGGAAEAPVHLHLRQHLPRSASRRKSEGLLYVGTDDGLVQVSTTAAPTGARTREVPPALPETIARTASTCSACSRRSTTRTPSTHSSTTTRTTTSSRTS